VPLSLIYKFADGLAFIGYKYVGRLRDVTLESLKIGLGDVLSPEDIRKIAFDTIRNFMRVGLELLAFVERPNLLDEYITIEGKENLQKALKRNRGVIGLTGHFGDFPLMCLKLAKEGFKVNVMARPARDARMDREITQIRTRCGVGTIYSYPRREAVRKSLEVLKKNEILVIQMDQNFGTGGIGVYFFGKKAATPKGPVVLGLRSGASIVPMFIIRDSEDIRRQKIIIEEPKILNRNENLQETIREYVQEFTSLLERYVRKYPDHWGWMHRRWKSKVS